jgi:hypothetical protein
MSTWKYLTKSVTFILRKVTHREHTAALFTTRPNDSQGIRNMHTIYKTIPEKDTLRIIDLCRLHSVKSGGIFEVYSGSKKETWSVIVNGSDKEQLGSPSIPLGIFYVNFAGAGVLSIEDEDPKYDGMASTKQHVKAVKTVIDRLLDAIKHPEKTVNF